MQTMFKLLGRWGLLAIFVFFGTEIFLRIFKPHSLQYYWDQKRLHRFHDETFIALEPNQDIYITHYYDLWEGRFSTNSLGFRATPEVDDASPKLLCLGDSLVMGFGVGDDDTFCKKLDFFEWKGEKLRSINLGVDGFGSYDYYLRLKEVLPLLKNVRLVLLFISPNDFTLPEVIRNTGVKSDDENREIRMKDPKAFQKFRMQFFITRYSYTLLAFKLFYEQMFVKFAIAKNEWNQFWNRLSESPVSYVQTTFVPERQAKISITPYENCPEVVPSSFSCQEQIVELKPLLPITQKAYASLLELTKSQNVNLVPIFTPVQVEEIYCFLNGKTHALSEYYHRSKKFFEEHKIASIDLLPYTKNMCAVNDRHVKLKGIMDHFIPGDGHLTKLGNDWMKESLSKALRSEKP